MVWYVYVLLSVRGSTYVGSTTDVVRRLRQHNGEIKGGAKTTRRERPWSIGCVYGPYPDQSQACKVECEVKKLKGTARLNFSENAVDFDGKDLHNPISND